MTMTISGNVINHYEEKVQQGAYVTIENYNRKCKHSGRFKKRDMPNALLSSVNTTITVLPVFVLELFPIFYTKICI